MSFVAVSSGIRSGDPVNGGTFTHTFTSAGAYYFRSQVHETFTVKITVIDCVSCVAVAGYDRVVPATLALALSSRAAGDFALAVGDAGMAQVMTSLTVYSGQKLTATGTPTPTGQLALLDATVTVLDGAALVVNAAYVSGGVSLAQRATMQDNTGQVAPTASGMAIPKVVATPAIAAAAVSSIDDAADTVTLSIADSLIAAGQQLRLIDTAGNTCAASPKGRDLTVLSATGAVIKFSTDITAGDGGAATHCAVSRAEVYALPACEVGDPPAVMYTHDSALDMDVLMTCSEMGGVAAWRSVLTMGGLIFDDPNIAGFRAAIGSGLPGMYVLRLFGDSPTFSLPGLGIVGRHNHGFSIPSLSIFPYQDVRIVSAATGNATLAFASSVIVASAGQLTVPSNLAELSFSGMLSLGEGVALTIQADDARRLDAELRSRDGGTDWAADAPEQPGGALLLRHAVAWGGCGADDPGGQGHTADVRLDGECGGGGAADGERQCPAREHQVGCVCIIQRVQPRHDHFPGWSDRRHARWHNAHCDRRDPRRGGARARREHRHHRYSHRGRHGIGLSDSTGLVGHRLMDGRATRRITTATSSRSTCCR